MSAIANSPKRIHTIGYGNRTIDEFTLLLKRFDVEYLVDIRSHPYSSYRPEFSREVLAAQLRQINIRYVFMGDTLGGQPEDDSCYVNGKVDYSLLRDREYYQSGITRLHAALSKQLSLVLMCTEAKPEECHRSKLIGQTLSEEGMEVLHIDEGGSLKTQDEVIDLLTRGQKPLFDMLFMPFTSRKKYRNNKG